MIKDLKDKVVVITGAASGIGRATALAFARKGAHIAAADLNESALATLKQDIKAMGVQCLTAKLDVAQADDVKTFAAHVEATLGVPHVVVNNAGIAYLGKFLDMDLAHWRSTCDVNLMGVVHGCYHFLPGMRKAGGTRHILNVASAAGNYPAPSMAAYAASKAAVLRFTDVLQLELHGTNVHAAAVCPGVINTPIATARDKMAVSDAQARRLAEYYRTKGCSPDVVAQDMVRAVQQGWDIVLTGPAARLGYHARRLSLRLARWVTLQLAPKIGYL